MDATRCPFLGLSDDPDTRLDFPSPGNVCHKASPTGPIKLEYQNNTCLTGQHVQCPIYTAAQPVPVPEALLAATPPRISLPQNITTLGRLPLVLGGLILLAVILFVLSSLLGNSNANASGQGSSGLQPTRPGLFGMPQTGGSQITVVPNATNALRHTTCPPPQGWVTYIVNPTDSLYRLSVVHAVPVEELQRANCMGDETVILPGQLIYIPFTPTQTPTVTATPTRFIPPSTATSEPNNPNPPPVNNPTDVPPTSAPPTRAPTTAVPPATAVPTTAVPPTRVPPTREPPTRVPPTQVPPTAVPPTAVVPTESPTDSPILPPIISTLLPPIFPTAEPTNTPPQPVDPGDGRNNSRSETIDCGGGTVTVDGNNNDVTITGACLGVVVNGNNNQVTVPLGTPVQDRGKNNIIEEG